MAHFIGSDYRVYNALIGFKQIKGEYIGENIAEGVIPVLEEYNII